MHYVRELQQVVVVVVVAAVQNATQYNKNTRAIAISQLL